MLAPLCHLALTAWGMLAASSQAFGQTPVAPVINPTTVSQAVATYAQRNGVPGVVVVLTDGPDVAYMRAFGHDSDGQPLTPRTPLPIASLSKSFTALAVMQLVEQGLIGLDEPVVAYLRDFRLADPRYRQITVRQILAHRSGMSDSTFREKSVTPVPASLAEAVWALHDATLGAAPAARRNYHNPNYWVAARLVEVVSGVPFDAYVRDRIFLPLGMAHSTTVNGLDGTRDVAAGHLRVLGQPFARAEPRWFLGGCSGVVTTAEDLARWLSYQAQAARGHDTRLASAEHVRLMHEGLGWNTLDGDPHGRRIMHNGILFTFSARQDLYPDAGRGIGIAVLTNTGVGLAPLDADAIAEVIRAAVLDGQNAQPAPIGLLVDSVLIALIVATLLGGWRAARRIRRNAARQVAPWRRASRLTAYALPVFWIAVYPWSLRVLFRRDLNWEQSVVLSPLTVVLVATLAAVAAALLILDIQGYNARADARAASPDHRQ
jgi:CubicO group peptidase (beta-lactamase class C family)